MSANGTEKGYRRLEEVVDQLDDAEGVQLRERLAELELTLEDVSWVRLGIADAHEFSRGGLNRIIRISRLMYLANPLIRRAVDIQADYVWGQGVNVKANDDTINEVLQKWLDDSQNAVELTGHIARLGKEAELRISGNVFLVMFTNPVTGMVRLRSFPAEECLDIITNPEDIREPWYYQRQWIPLNFDENTGTLKTNTTEKVYYPDWRYNPAQKPPTINGSPVKWDAPVYHIHTGALIASRFGVPEIYPAIDWARAVKEDLEDYASIRKSLTRFAWKATTKAGPRGVAAAKSRLNTTYGNDPEATDTNPPPVAGSTWIQNDATDLVPINKSGATLNPEEARRMWLMVSAATGIPEVMLSGDATLGSYATAKTLDRPTELKMRNRQGLWANILADILGYVIDKAATARRGPLKGKLEVDAYTGASRVVITTTDPETGEPAEADRRIDIDFPEILERDMQARVGAIVSATTLNGQPPAGTFDMPTVRRLLLNALAQDDVDELLDGMFAATYDPQEPGEPGDPGPQPAPADVPAPLAPPVPMEQP